MIRDACSLDDDVVEEADVCIVGVGPVSLTMLRRLREVGLSVIVLESGNLGWDAAAYYMNEGESFGVPGGDDIVDTRFRGLGGTAQSWHIDIEPGVVGARFRPLDPEDFKLREWIPGSGWPITYEDLIPHFERAQAVSGLGRLDYASEPWMNASTGPLIQSDRLEPIVFQGGASRLFTEQPLNDYRDGTDIRIFTRATAHSVDFDPADTVQSIQATDPYGRNIIVRARAFVLAAGGLENTRLLLKLRSEGNSARGIRSSHLGRTFMEHVHCTTSVLVPENPAWLDELPAHSWHSCRGKPIQWKYRLSHNMIRSERIGQFCMYLRPTEIRDLPEYLRAPTLAATGNGQQVFAIEVMTEQVPNPASRVELSERPLPGLDLRHGTQLRLYWELCELDLRTLLVGQDIVEQELEKLGLGKFIRGIGAWTAPYGVSNGHHHMGTTRMSKTDKHGVVDPECRVHGLQNLYVAGSSVFPTGGFANPTLTAMALGDRLAVVIAAISK